MPITISKTVGTYPRLPYQSMQEAILGKNYSLSLVFIGERRALSLNKKHRNKTYIPNVLSFSLSKGVGEIYISPSVAEREAKRSGTDVRTYVGFLFIHGLLHLKGYRHGATMDRAEKKYLAKFGLE